MGIFKTMFKKNKKKHSLPLGTAAIEELFEELNEVFMKKKRVSDYLIDLENREEEIKKFQALDKEDIEKLNVLANKARDIEDKKQNLRGRLIKNNKALFLISQYEEELPTLIKEMYESEKKQKETERNIFYLQEEKEALLEEREVLIKGYRFLKVFSITFVIIIALCVIITSALMQMLRDEVWLFLGLFGVLMIVFLVGILYSKDRIDRALRDNVILQQKAAKYLNKAKISYFHQIRYLTFQYEKLGVDSVAKLEMYYNRYIKNKDNEKKYLQLNQIISEIEEKMIEVIRNKNIQIDYIENLADWAIAPKKVNALKTLKADKQKTEEQLQALNTYEENLWKEVFALQEEKNSQEMIQDKINEYNSRMNRYLDKTSKDA
ncbi:hypothetical protein [Cellulosilyticum sp. I15G10I2]|uniref:hypothetical protein n=1 Tax=Cellulosilyticum sp. I15G10I2 TaxID=1892843 RepID=UPI00085C0938|nr:hypothetical protein [Cellulosilyticum sp. I15G10I2]